MKKRMKQIVASILMVLTVVMTMISGNGKVFAAENDAKGSIKLCVMDAGTSEFKPQGDATLEGAVFGLYARYDITHPDGVTGVIYEKDELVTTMTTDEKGEAMATGLYLGNYYVKIITPSEGYQLRGKEADVLLLTEETRRVETWMSVMCQPVVVRMRLQKDGLAKTEALQGAGFSIYLKSALPTKEDGTYDFTAATPMVLDFEGNTELLTNEYGNIFTEALPYGTYIVVRTTTPEKTTTAQPFEVVLLENSPKQPLEEHTLVVTYQEDAPEPPSEEPIEKPEKEPEKESEEKPVVKAPKTGDTSIYGICISVALIVLAIVSLIVLKKRCQKK